MLKDGKLKGWKEVPIGGIIPADDSHDVETGTWRSKMPIIDPNKCVNCMICWSACPDHAILPENGKFGYFDYFHCKGCGICAQVCPVNAITMEIESKVDKSKVPKAKNLK